MRLKLGLILLFLVIFVLNIQAENIADGYAWLLSRSVNGAYNNNIIDTSSAVFALSSRGYSIVNEIAYLKSQENSNHCWPKSSCRVKDTAFALLALDMAGEDTSNVENWLRDAQTATLITGNWILQIKTGNTGTCSISYTKRGASAATTKSIAVDEGVFPGCGGLTWFNLNTCLESNLLQNNPSLNLDLDCSELGDAVISLVYKLGSEYYLIKSVHSTVASLTIENGCFGQQYRSACNLESTAYANWALKNIQSDISNKLYLEINHNPADNLHNALLSLITNENQYKDALVQSQRVDGSWDGIYKTSLGVIALRTSSPSEAIKGKEYIKNRQFNDGSWGSVLDTAMALYALSDEAIEIPPCFPGGLAENYEPAEFTCDDSLDNDCDDLIDCDDSDCGDVDICYQCPDWDADGICDSADDDIDGDTVSNDNDQEIFTPIGCDINLATGVHLDFDDDEVCNGLDLCEETKTGCQVGADGCPLSCDTAACVGDPACECSTCDSCFDVYGWICSLEECATCSLGKCYLEEVPFSRNTCEDCSLVDSCSVYDFMENCEANPCGEKIGNVCYWNATSSSCCDDKDEDDYCDENDPCPDDPENLCVGTCTDGIKNQDERGIDCGGVCDPFDDCCSNSVQDDGEDGVDCGGVCGACEAYVCGDGKCETDKGEDYDLCPDDCLPSSVIDELCSNGRIDETTNEEGVDCGGLCPESCEISPCLVDGECQHSIYDETMDNCPEDCLCGDCDHFTSDYPDNCPAECEFVEEEVACNNDGVCDINEDCTCDDCKDEPFCKEEEKGFPWAGLILVFIIIIIILIFYFRFYRKGKFRFFKKKPKKPEKPAYKPFAEKLEAEKKPPVYGRLAKPGLAEKRKESRIERELRKSIEEAKKLISGK